MVELWWAMEMTSNIRQQSKDMITARVLQLEYL